MKIIKVSIFIIVTFVFTILPALAGTAMNRTAVIEDRAGIVSEVNGFYVEGDYKNNFTHIFSSSSLFTPSSNEIVLYVEPFYVGVPLNFVTSVTIEKDICKIGYNRHGKTENIQGKLIDFGSFIGKTDFGDFKLDMSKLRKLTFKESISTSVPEKLFKPDTTLVLLDDERVFVKHLQRFDTFCSTAGYSWGCGARYESYNDFRLLRGDSLINVSFKNIKSIEFIDGKAKITLKNGKETIGELPSKASEEGAAFEGFTGVYDRGEFWISPEKIKSVIFGIVEK